MFSGMFQPLAGELDGGAARQRVGCTLRHEHAAIRSLVSYGAGRFRSALELVDVFCSSACVLRTLFLKAALDFFAEIAGTGRQFCLLGLSPTRRLRSYNNLVNKRDARRRACSCTCSVEARPLEVRRMYKHASPYTLSAIRDGSAVRRCAATRAPYSSSHQGVAPIEEPDVCYP